MRHGAGFTLPWRRDWLEQFSPRGSLPGVLFFGLSAKGLGFLEKGELWWQSLGPWQKFQVALAG